MGVIVKNERGGSLFYTLTKNQIVRIISIASYLTKKNLRQKNYLLQQTKVLFGTHIFFQYTNQVQVLGLPELKIKQNYVQQIIVFLNETEEGEQRCNLVTVDRVDWPAAQCTTRLKKTCQIEPGAQAMPQLYYHRLKVKQHSKH